MGVRAATVGRPYINTVPLPLTVITPLSLWRGLGVRLLFTPFGEGPGMRLFFSSFGEGPGVRLLLSSLIIFFVRQFLAILPKNL